MASPNPGGNVYKRDTPEDLHRAWNAVIRKVNDERENPPEDTNCEALSPIGEVEANHIWTQTDIEDVRSAIDEMCAYAWTEDLEYWKDAIITEIDEALNREWGGWGDEDECCEEECIPACSDCEEESDTFEVVAAEGCLIWPMWQCLIDYIQWIGVVRPAALDYGTIMGPLYAAISLFEYYHAAYCRAFREVEDLEEELAALEAIRDAACSQIPPDPAACAAAQADVDEKQEELDEKIEERDEYQEEMDTAAADADAPASAQGAIINAASHPEQQNMWPLVTATNHPWADQDCAFRHGYRGVERCRWRWNLGFQTNGGPWNVRWSGGYTPNGIPYATSLSVNSPFASYHCILCCWSVDPSPCQNPASACAQAGSCPATWRLHAYSDATACGAYDPSTGLPC